MGHKRLCLMVAKQPLIVEGHYDKEGFVDGGITVYLQTHCGDIDISELVEVPNLWSKLIDQFESSLYEDGYDK